MKEGRDTDDAEDEGWRKEERKGGGRGDLRKFRDSRTLREREENAEERPKGGCSKSREDERELRRLAGYVSRQVCTWRKNAKGEQK